MSLFNRPAPQPVAEAPVAQVRLTARGQLRPAREARVGTISGGVVRQLSVNAGSAVAERAEVARVESAGSVEMLTAPFSGTVANVLVHEGDTVVPSTVLLVVADLHTLQVETSDVDEFLVAHVRPGQQAQVQVDAVEGRVLSGRVRTVAQLPQSTAGGDMQYPVIVDIGAAAADLRAGMSVRVTFIE